MTETNFGYCCINLELGKQKVTTNRSMVKRTFEAKGIEYASELALQNVRDLARIISWNHQHGVKLYRMSSDIFPWMSEYELKDLPDYERISNILKGAGKIAKTTGQRITFHPGHFCVIASTNQDVVTKSIKDLNQHGEIMDLMDLPRTPYAAINIHVNTTQGGKDVAIERFAANFQLLDESVRTRLVVENDDKQSQYTVEDLAELHGMIGTPVTFDYHHHWCHPGSLTQEQALKLAATTWPSDVKQLCHYSSAKCVYEDESVMNRAHADYIYEHINDYGLALDIELEAKAKEQAWHRYMKQFAYETV
jgi:UV DNA damage endonuclease